MSTGSRWFDLLILVVVVLFLTYILTVHVPFLWPYRDIVQGVGVITVVVLIGAAFFGGRGGRIP